MRLIKTLLLKKRAKKLKSYNEYLKWCCDVEIEKRCRQKKGYARLDTVLNKKYNGQRP